MTKSELIKKIYAKYGKLSIEKIHSIVNNIFEQLSCAVSSGKRVELRGFGAFSLRKRSFKSARNPKTNEFINIADRNVVYFRVGKEFKEYINAK